MSETAWGQLVSLTDFDTPPILLTDDVFKIGRAADCDLPFPNNKLISGHHCHIQKDQDGKVQLVDTSTNGTLLNMNIKVTKGKSEELNHGDEFYLVFKKDNQVQNIGYIYQDLAELAKEDSSPIQETDATLEDSDCNFITPVKVDTKRKSEGEDEAKYVKRLKMDEAAESSSSRKDVDVDVEADAHRHTEEEEKCDITETKQPSVAETTDKGVANTSSSGVTESDNKKCDIDTKGSTVSQDAADASAKTTTTTTPAASTATPAASTTTPAASTTTPATSTTTASAVSAATSSNRDDMEDELQCIICQDIMHDCISLQPCLHCFCSGCYSGWMKKSSKCPSCRKVVKKINKNHMVNNLIEAYLKAHPEKKRSEEDIKELDEKNTITKDMLYRRDSDDYNSSDYYSSDDDNEPVTGGFGSTGNPAVRLVNPPILPPPPQPTLFGFGTPVFGVNRAFKTVCRQCPDYKDPDTDTASGVVGGIKNVVNAVKTLITGTGNQTNVEPIGEPSDADGTQDYDAATQEAGPSDGGRGEPNNPGPSTSGEGVKKPSPVKDDEKVMPDAPPHQCTPVQNHVLCQCCLQPFPDFRLNPYPPDDRPQQCGMCYRAYCHAYWGCKKADCLGCLNKFQDMNFGRKALAGLILDNHHESEIFKNYIDDKGMSVKDVLRACCKEMEAGRFSVPAQATQRFNIYTPVCYACGLVTFKQLAFQYRQTLKKEDFPDHVQRRPDCYWGSKCRTQRNKPHHAKNFNHICDQTRQF